MRRHASHFALALFVLLSAIALTAGTAPASEADQNKPTTFTMPEVLEILGGQGYEKFRRAERVGDEFVVVAKSVGDRNVRLRINAYNGEVIEEIELD